MGDADCVPVAVSGSPAWPASFHTAGDSIALGRFCGCCDEGRRTTPVGRPEVLVWAPEHDPPPQPGQWQAAPEQQGSPRNEWRDESTPSGTRLQSPAKGRQTR